MGDSAARPFRPSVTWDLGSPSVSSAATTSSRTHRAWASPHRPLAPTAQSFSIMGDSAARPFRPSVTWDLGSPYVSSAATTSSGTHRASASLHVRLSSQPETNVGTRPRVIFPPPRSAQPPVFFSLMNSSEAGVKKLLPKSNLFRVITRDNPNAQRICEMEIKAIEKTKKKTSQFYDHLRKKFMTDQLRKLGRWRQESMKIQQYLDKLHVDELQSKRKSQPP
ncbi:uncharacterized protein C5orf52 homolog [Ailuropoda melanoleuca]|uniref:Uncharacterized protein n=1 Tax=Ailuropoda melanoleuca TaxID=9646 RepID=A0A7N5JDF4_AILME|nr:uncharacterized protein C5orf52 homolog [Ailuropoda melanoleuca]